MPRLLAYAAAVLAPCAAFAAGVTGPSSSRAPYLETELAGLTFTSVLSAGDLAPRTSNPAQQVRLVGIPDGLGAYDNGNGTFTLLCNHEILRTTGIVRAHGAIGAFVSSWVIDKTSLAVLSGDDLIKNIQVWNPVTSSYAVSASPIALDRLCSADLPAPTALFNPATNFGTQARIFFNGEESERAGRALATVVDGALAGTAYILPHLGIAAWENVVLSPFAQNKTIAVLADDDDDGQVYIYVGLKNNTGATPVERAGLVGGLLYGLRVPGKLFETGTNGGAGPVSGAGLNPVSETATLALVNGGNVVGLTGQQFEDASDLAGVTQFGGPEDQVWDTRPGFENVLYFTTKGSTVGGQPAPTRLWRLTFNSILTPETGGTLDLLLDSARPGPRIESLDNLTQVGSTLYIVEDRGSDPTLSPLLAYDLVSGRFERLANHEPAFFHPLGASFITANEEASGIIPLDSILGPGSFAVSVQAHDNAHLPAAIRTEVVEGGQILVFRQTPGRTEDFVRTALVTRNDPWRYLADGSNPGPTWKDPLFNDTLWPSGTPEIGFGDGDETTVVTPTPVAPVPAVSYFRRQFSVAAPDEVLLELFLKRDDGAVVYLNGVEVGRSNVSPSLAVAQGTYSGQNAADESEWVFLPLSCEGALVAGTNTLAIAILQNNDTSSDLSFAAELIALRRSPTPGIAPVQPTGLTASQTNGIVNLSWTGQSGLRGYQIERRRQGDLGWTVLTTDHPGTINSYTDSTTGSGGTFEYRIRAFNVHGASVCSAIASVTVSIIFTEDFATVAGFQRFQILNTGTTTNRPWTWTASFGALTVGNGFGGTPAGAPTESWMITPALNFQGFKSIVLSFLNISNFNDFGADGISGTADDLGVDPGPDNIAGTADDFPVTGVPGQPNHRTFGLRVRVSDNYNPVAHASNPRLATWTDVTLQAAYDLNFASFGSGVNSGPVDLSAFKGKPAVHVAFVYTASGTASNRARAWEIDNVVVNGVPTGSVLVDFTAAPRFILPGGTVNFTSQLSGAITPVTYAWDFGDGTTSNLANPTKTYTNPGRYDVTLSVTDGAGDSGTRTRTAGVVVSVGGIPPKAGHLRVATYNASLNRLADGALVTDLSTTTNAQAKQVAEIIQRIDPDILLVNEFDFVPSQLAANLFRTNYLEQVQTVGVSPITFPYVYVAPSNTGISSGRDFDNNGVIDTTPGDDAYGNDSFGFGIFPGQFAMVVYSKYPIATSQVRTFQNFLWNSLPGNVIPPGWYDAGDLAIFRLSSKSHWDIPINVGGRRVHLLASHPTPPVFDGAEDRNGRRNHDEIRLWAEYIDPASTVTLTDDAGVPGGLGADRRFVIAGDQNADPVDGDSFNNAILQILNHPLVDATNTPQSDGAEEDVPASANQPRTKTASFNLRADYVLPSTFGWSIVQTGHFWPINAEATSPLINASDHRPVWVDLNLVREGDEFAEWRQINGYTGLGGSTSDDDGDGLNNDSERLFKGNPLQFEADRGRLVEVGASATHFDYALVILNDPFVGWRIEKSADLTATTPPGGWVTAVAGVDYTVVSDAPVAGDPNARRIVIRVPRGSAPSFIALRGISFNF